MFQSWLRPCVRWGWGRQVSRALRGEGGGGRRAKQRRGYLAARGPADGWGHGGSGHWVVSVCAAGNGHRVANNKLKWQARGKGILFV